MQNGRTASITTSLLLWTLALGSSASLGASPARDREPRGKGAADSLRVGVEILPGVRDKIVDPRLAEGIPVAILGDRDLDATAIDPSSIVLAGAAVTKDEDGALATYRDVNGDGVEDLIVEIGSSRLRLGPQATRAWLTGRALDGRLLRGSGVLRTAAAVRDERRRTIGAGREAGKRPPLDMTIDVLPEDSTNRLALGNRGTVPVGVVSTADLDATALDPALLELAGAPVTRRAGGGMGSIEDVDGDGRLDLVIEVPKRLLHLPPGDSTVVLTGLTREGRVLEGADRVTVDPIATLTFSSEEPQALTRELGVDFASTGAITVNDLSPASPYPSTIAVGGLTGVISKVKVTLKGINHTSAYDLDILLVAPTGQSFVLMSDNLGFNPITDVTLTFDDDAELTPPASPPAPGTAATYRPFNSFGCCSDSYAAPAPTPSQAVGLASFNGLDPNGTWSLYVMDDESFDTGTIAGWSIDFILATRTCSGSAMTINDLATATPYPSPLAVAGLTGVISKTTLTLRKLTHTFPTDIDLLLVNPSGLPSLLMSDTGGGAPGISDGTLVLDDNAELTLEAFPNPESGTYPPLNFGSGDAFPAPAPGPAYALELSIFRGTDPNGAWRLFVLDDASLDVGSLGDWCLDITTMTPIENSNQGTITIPVGAPPITTGPAAPYPSSIVVSGVTGTVFDATATLRGLTHTFPLDLDVLLVAPSGANVLLMSDVGGGGPGVAGVTLTFDDAAASSIAPAIPPTTGSYRPSNTASPDPFPGPAPPGPYGSGMISLYGAAPNGRWDLFVFDDTGGDVGAIAGGWTLTLRTWLDNSASCSFSPITIPAGAPGTTTGPATPYPATVFVGIPATLAQHELRVGLLGLTHTFPSDLDILLVSPSGRKVMLMSDAGSGGPGVSGVDLLFDDDALGGVPELSNPDSGTYRPTNLFDGFPDALPAPAPAGPYASTLASLEGSSPMGTWSLYIADDASGDVGVLSGWCLYFDPSLNAAEVPNLRWRDSSTLSWDAGPNATSYKVYRGEKPFLRELLTTSNDSCLRGESPGQALGGLTEDPPAGKIYWYLVLGRNTQEEGPAGFARRGVGDEPARVLNSTGSCP